MHPVTICSEFIFNRLQFFKFQGLADLPLCHWIEYCLEEIRNCQDGNAITVYANNISLCLKYIIDKYILYILAVYIPSYRYETKYLILEEKLLLRIIVKDVWMFSERCKTISSLFTLVHSNMFLFGSIHQNFS